MSSTAATRSDASVCRWIWFHANAIITCVSGVRAYSSAVDSPRDPGFCATGRNIVNIIILSLEPTGSYLPTRLVQCFRFALVLSLMTNTYSDDTRQRRLDIWTEEFERQASTQVCGVHIINLTDRLFADYIIPDADQCKLRGIAPTRMTYIPGIPAQHRVPCTARCLSPPRQVLCPMVTMRFLIFF